MENGYTWSVEHGIHIYFDNINQDFLINKIQNHISDDKIPNLIITYLKWTLIDVHIIYDVNAKKTNKVMKASKKYLIHSNIYEEIYRADYGK